MQELVPAAGGKVLFKHPGTKGIEVLIHDLLRAAERVRDFLPADSWKVMVWGVAIPYRGFMEAKRHGVCPVEVVKEQVTTLFEYMRSRTGSFALAVMCIVDNVPADKEIPKVTEVLSAWNDRQQACVMYVAGFHSTRVGACFQDQSMPVGTAENEKNQVKSWLLSVFHQAGWTMMETGENETNHFYANELLRLHQWGMPPLMQQAHPCPHSIPPEIVIEPNQVDTLHRMLSKHPHVSWHMHLDLGDPKATTQNGSFSYILADSTIMLSNCGHHWVRYSQELLGIAVGQYGGAFHDGSFDHLKDWIKVEMVPKLLAYQNQELVVGYVPAEGFKDWPYESHASQQRLNFDGKFIRTPTIDTFAKVYRKMTGGNMIKATGVHLTEPGRLWFAWALQIWLESVALKVKDVFRFSHICDNFILTFYRSSFLPALNQH